MYWMHLWHPTVRAQQNIFEKNYTEVRSPHHYASYWHLLGPNWLIIRSLNYVRKSTNRCYRRKMSSISKFFCMVKDTLCREWLTNLDAKGTKRSVWMWPIDFHKMIFENILFHTNFGLSKIRSVHRYVLKGFFLMVSTVMNRIHQNLIVPASLRAISEVASRFSFSFGY